MFRNSAPLPADAAAGPRERPTHVMRRVRATATRPAASSSYAAGELGVGYVDDANRWRGIATGGGKRAADYRAVVVIAGPMSLLAL